jgi:gamma-glutamyltranspeptidase/glutathione hydrolase
MMSYDPLYYPYPSRRSLVYGTKGMAAASQPLAAQAALDILKQGGNAIDAAVSAAACLTVVEPTCNGLGGDAFAIVYTKGKIYGLNSSGPAPKSLSLENLKKAGYDKVPQYGVFPITVPGAPAAWAALSKRFGKLPYAKLFESAIMYAEEGFPVSPIVSKLWHEAFEAYKNQNISETKSWFETFAPSGKPPGPGQIFRSKGHASALRTIAETQSKDFYNGNIAEKIEHFVKKHGGFLSVEDLSQFESQWVEPLKTNYRGYEVWELPPNGQGMVVLMALNILSGFDFSENGNIVDNYHRQIEAVKMAFTDGLFNITDPKMMKIRPEELLSETYAKERRAQIGKTAVSHTPWGSPDGGTVYLATADSEGNMVSFIQSNFFEFGSGVVVPGTGVALQNRGFGFSTDPNHINCLMPGKRTYHTIIPGFLTKNGEPVGPFGIMGGYIQPQAHVQVLINALDYNLNPQAALDAPRWRWLEGNKIEVEQSFPEHIAQALLRRGHQVLRGPAGAETFGRGQIIWRSDEGTLTGATEPRTDGTVAVW